MRQRLAPSAARRAISRERRGGAREQEIRYVRAGDQQDQRDNRHEDPERRADGADELVSQAGLRRRFCLRWCPGKAVERRAASAPSCASASRVLRPGLSLDTT